MADAGGGAPAPPAAPGAEQRGTLPEPEVRAMFDRIARVYDLINSVMTAGLHHQWRRRAADLAGVGPGDRVLDVATGTGDLAIELASRVAPAGEVVGSDFSEEMLAHARRKVPGSDLSSARASAAHARKKAPTVRFEWGNALDLPYADGEFAAATVGFGARNFSDLDRGLAEMARVVKPGGRVVILEITTPQKPPLSTFFSLWFDRVVPLIGKVAGDPAAYDYLPNSVKRFPEPAGLAAALQRAGLEQIRWVLTAGGIIALHVGVKPAGTTVTSTNGTRPSA
jgi:demethylmenaquinone methyltransferase/2-methoxy-6-polyprenyl-1,4-benzoquinol methylase